MSERGPAEERFGDREALGRLLGLLAHDLKNPLAIVSGNLAYLCEEVGEGPLKEALGDSEEAARELARGLRHLAWIGLALAGEAPVSVTRERLDRALLRAMEEAGVVPEVTGAGGDRRVAAGGEGLTALLALLLRLAARAPGPPRLSLEEEAGAAVISFHGRGEAIDPALRPRLYEAAAQLELKEAGSARSERFAPWLVIGLLARTIGARLELGEGGESPWVRVHLPLAE